MSNRITPTVFYRTLNMGAGNLLSRSRSPGCSHRSAHGFPSSSHMFRNLIPMLADKYHVAAPDFPGYGESSAPSVSDFDYSYERLATVTEKFTEKLNLSSYALFAWIFLSVPPMRQLPSRICRHNSGTDCR